MVLSPPATGAIDMNYAGFWARVGAYLIDAILLSIVNMVLFTVFGFSMMPNPAMSDQIGSGSFWLVYCVVVALNLLYFALLESSARQATVGKMALGLIVTDTSGQRISFLRATGRYFAKILSGAILLIGFIMVAFTERKQGLHDMLASTLVLKAKPGESSVNADVFA
jgi:uncharacterized RDD family membrane protein YckC